MAKTEHTKRQEQLIGLLLKHKDLVDKFINSPVKVKDFDEEYQPILTEIIKSYNEDFLLTRQGYRAKIKNIQVPKERIIQELTFDSCSISPSKDRNLFLPLMQEIQEHGLGKNICDALSRFKGNPKKARSRKQSLIELHEDLGNIVADMKTDNEDKTMYEETVNIGDRFTQYISDIQEGKIKPKPKILCGIPEIDETIVTGFIPGTLSLVCAETRGFKSWMLLNIALSAWKNGLNVAYVTIEMDEDSVFKRKLSIETGIQHSQLYDEQNLTSEDLGRIKETVGSWKELTSKFRVLDLVGSIATASNIRRLIKQDIDDFKPDLVVVDYISIMGAEEDRHNRYDLVIGDNAKAFRSMGKQLGCSVITAAQQKRESLGKRKKDPMDFGPEDISGSQELANDCDNIFYQRIMPDRPNELCLKVVKVRNGKYTFPNNENIAKFDIIAGTGKIVSQSGSHHGEDLVVDKKVSQYFDNETVEQEEIDVLF